MPTSKDEANNAIVRTWAPEGMKIEQNAKLLSHHEVLARIDGYDPDRGVKVMGHRGYFLKDWGVLLAQALINYSQHFLRKKGFALLQTPQLMLKSQMVRAEELGW